MSLWPQYWKCFLVLGEYADSLGLIDCLIGIAFAEGGSMGSGDEGIYPRVFRVQHAKMKVDVGEILIPNYEFEDAFEREIMI